MEGYVEFIDLAGKRFYSIDRIFLDPKATLKMSQPPNNIDIRHIWIHDAIIKEKVTEIKKSLEEGTITQEEANYLIEDLVDSYSEYTFEFVLRKSGFNFGKAAIISIEDTMVIQV